MTGYEQFITEYENLRTAFRATSRDINEMHARLVGCLTVIVPVLADDASLRVMAEAMRNTVKSETLRTLGAIHE